MKIKNETVTQTPFLASPLLSFTALSENKQLRDELCFQYYWISPLSFSYRAAGKLSEDNVCVLSENEVEIYYIEAHILLDKTCVC